MRNFGLLLFSRPRGIRNAIELAVRYVAEIEIGAVIPKWAVRCGFLDNGLAPSLMPINSRGILGKHFFSLPEQLQEMHKRLCCGPLALGFSLSLVRL